MIPQLRYWESGSDFGRVAKIKTVYLDEAITCVAREVRNGEFVLEMTYPADGKYAEYLVPGVLIYAPYDSTREVQPFELYRRDFSLSGLPQYYAQHVSYGMNYAFFTDNITGSGNHTIYHALQNGACSPQFGNPLLGNTDTYIHGIPIRQYGGYIEPSGSIAFKYDGTQNLRPMRDVLVGPEDSVLALCGGEVQWNYCRFWLKNARGSEKGVYVWYGGNLTEANQQLDSSGCAGRVWPYWNDGTEWHRAGTSYDWTTVNSAIDPGFLSYRAEPLDVTGLLSYPATDNEIRAFLLQYSETHNPWLPFNSLDIDLSLGSDHIGAPVPPDMIQSVNLCDIVKVAIPKFNFIGKAKVVTTEYNVLMDRYDRLVLGNIRPSLAQTILSEV